MTRDYSLEKPPSCAPCPFYAQRRVPARGRDTSPILLVGDWPSPQVPDGGSPFSDRNGVIVGMALKKLRAQYQMLPDGYKRLEKLEPYTTYAVQCVNEDPPKKDVVTACSGLMDALLSRVKPKVVVAFGSRAAQAMLKEKVRFDDVLGTFQQRAVGLPDGSRHSYDVFVTYSPKAVLVKPGLFDELVRALKRVWLTVEGKDDQDVIPESVLRENYRFPRTVAEVAALCDEIINYSNDGADPLTHFIAVDTETSSLEMYDPESLMIMISFAWAKLKAASIVLDHPNAWWTPEELEQVKYHVQRVLACKKPKVLHHEKFDRQVIVHRYGWKLENVVWDTMGGEHLLEEDKKGAYGLKLLTKTRLPEYSGYEDKVGELREAHGGKTRAEEAKRYRKAVQAHEKALEDYAKACDRYDLEFGKYAKALDAWEAKRKAEKERADLARKNKETDKVLRSIRKDVIGKKPPKPRKPKPPTQPEHQEPFDFTMIPLEDLELYASVDADVTRQHALHQNARMNKEQKKDAALCQQHRVPAPKPFRALMQEHVLPTSATLADMEFTGFPVDLPYLEDLDAKLEKVVQAAETRLYELAEGAFVINNPAELGRIMFHRGFLQDGHKVRAPLDDNIRRTSRGQTASDEKTLKYLANSYGFEFPQVVLTYRKAQKARSPFLINVREHARFDGRMHSTFHLTGTGTGRLSSSNENMQNVPKKLAGFNIKKIFIPPPGYTLVNTDAKGAEIRIFAAYSQDEKLIQAILDGLDTHSFFTANVFGEDYDSVERARDLVDRHYAGENIEAELVKWAEALVRKRTNCKRVVFGTLYGAMAPKIAETAGISLKEAQEVIDLMFQMFPSIPAYIDSTQNEVRLFNWVCTYTGRKRRFPMSNMRMFRNRCYRQAVNFKIQSTSSDIVLWVLNQIHPVVKRDLRGQFHATVHDSIVFSVPDAYVTQVKDLMYEYGTVRTQKQFPWMPVPFLWDVEVGRSYGEVADISKYLQGHKHEQKEPEEIITDQDVKDEINQYYAN